MEASIELGHETVSQHPVARLEYICSRDGRVTKGLGNEYVAKDSSDFAIKSDRESLVSRNHCEIYTVVYEKGINFVYVRDRKSFNGTYVNKMLVGKGPGLCSGFLLQDGDTIEILPYWKFILHQENSPPKIELSEIQLAESMLFSDKYLISRRCIGQGVDANVFLAEETATRRQIVCKVMNLDEYQNRLVRDGSRRKLQEADLLRQLRHPNILAYVDSISSPHSLYAHFTHADCTTIPTNSSSFIFTELATGGDLMSFINRQNGVKEFDCRIIIRQVLRGLSYLHSKGIIHRDLKPENILLAYSPKVAYHRIMLSDFATCAVPRRSRLKTMVGTANYQAPELHAATQDHQTPAIDMWAVGIITAIMLTASLDIDDVIAKLCYSDQDAILQNLKCNIFLPDLKLSKNSKTFVWQCLQRSPQDRQTVLEAECHDWLCTPEEHLRFFEQLDYRVLGEWEMQAELSPMPLQLPSVLMASLATEQGQDELFKSYLSLARRHPLLQTEFSQHFRNFLFKNEAQRVVPDSQPSTNAETQQSRGAQDKSPSSTLISQSTATDNTGPAQTTACSPKQSLAIRTKRRLPEPCSPDPKMKSLRRKTNH
ncbi:hypothetical protein C2857_004786 [Epichloe festucae Fl1]|uniref:Serine/threonine protein kinase n=1 Tax=Epichloe festucae (strain Fl1) TaxID=877507 RepID=A0A7U3SMM4_EPIFF|nr:hypothetical protein C2857_004786 [Epichloe festucae Fl1]